ncbi:MAG: YihY/virulence factor BrkB family protein [Solirubrobacterales bacterium]|nr:YihY/virulence factor BrkB family protein [Solirubrobacterales bacterium]
MDPLAPIKSFDRFQRRHSLLAVPIAVLKNISDQGAGNASVLIAWWAFFSIFPLLLLFSTILGFVLQNHPSVERDLVNSALKQFPIVGADLGNLHGSSAGLTIGIIGTIWSGLGVTVAAQNAFNRVYTVPHYRQPNFFTSRLRGLMFLAAVGLLQVISTAASGVVSAGLGGVLLTIGGLALSLVLNLIMFTLAFRFFVREVPTSELWPGIVMAAVGWLILQAVGGIYIDHVVKGAGQTYGTFATVIGLLAWLYLGARIVVFSAEVNVTLIRRLWPRSIMDPPEEADRRARAALAKMEERDDKETIEVAFHPPDKGKRTHFHEPPYAVAPEPEPGESARPASTRIAIPDLHTLTTGEVIVAIEHALDGVEASRRSKQEARAWLRAANETLSGERRATGDDQAAAVEALAEAIRDALGLAPG